MKRYYIALAALTLFIVFVISWTQYTRYIQFSDYHKIISQHSTHTVAGSIRELMLQKTHLMKLFLEHYESNFQKVIDDVNNYTRIDYLSDEIREHFPQSFAFTITDDSGRPLLEDIESLIGPICLQDLQQYIQTGKFQQRIHPGMNDYHYDVVQSFNNGGKRYIFFLSFRAEELSNIITTSQAPSHQTALILPQNDNKILLEVLSSGARNTVIRDSYYLSPSEKEQIIARENIEGTHWQVIDSYTAELYTDFIHALIKDTVLYFISYSIIISILFIYLLRADKRKRLAEQHKNEFLSTVSHELRTPLTAIMGSLGLVTNLKKDEFEKSQALLKIAYNHTKRLATLVNDILDMQKVEAGKMEFSMQEWSLQQLLQESVDDIASYAESKNARVIIRDSAQTIRLLCDYDRIMQVMFNLLSNAIKYGKDSDTILVSSTLLENNILRVTVTDHGEGIPEEFQDRIFDKFTQADASSTRSTSGTGLGLSIVKRIIEAHHGSIGFDSRPGKGTSFYFDLPALS